MPIPRWGQAERENVLTAMNTGSLSDFYRNPLGGAWIQAFEKKLADYHKMPYAVAVSNGTTALQLAIEAVMSRMGRIQHHQSWGNPETGLPLKYVNNRWRYVVTTPYSFIATASSILMAGCEPYFIDVDRDSYTIPSKEDTGAGIPREARVILPVHLLGHPADIDRIRQAGTWDYIIEDNAQGIGASYKGELCGTLGDISTCSFQFTKTITTGGEGGAILTRDLDLYEKLLSLRSHGSQYKDDSDLTYNARMTEPQAAFGCAQLDRLDTFIKIQRANAEYIFNHLPNGLCRPKIADNVKHSFFLIPLIYDREAAGMSRDEFLQRVTEAGVNKKMPGASIGTGYDKPLYMKPLLQKYKPERGCPNTEAIMQKSIWLDIHRWKELEAVKEDLEKITAILEGRKLN